jgi:hypothetical protein
MEAVFNTKKTRRLLPINSLVFVTESEVERLKPGRIAADVVGQKTFGLLCLPAVWTLPFVGVSSELYQVYSSTPKGRKKLISHWSRMISDAAQNIGILSSDKILVRSSGCAEGIDRRGEFYSSVGELRNIQLALTDCLNKLISDSDLLNEEIPPLVQKRCQPESAKGHLSNERRCYEEHRDWMGEMELAGSIHMRINKATLVSRKPCRERIFVLSAVF